MGGRHRLTPWSVLHVAGQLGHSGLDAGDTGLDGCENNC
jgi:hypothetical protein